MKGSSQILVAVALSATASLAAAKTGPESPLHIRLYDHAQVPAGTLKCAMAETSRIFSGAGIKILWQWLPTEPPVDQGEDQSSPAAFRRQAERDYLAVRIIPRVPANMLPGALGFALPFAQTGAHVSVFYDRIAAAACSWNASLYVALGYAMAHEIGHVLLRSPEHSSGGLMQARWNQTTWHLASQGVLAFAPEQKKQMHERVRQMQSGM